MGVDEGGGGYGFARGNNLGHESAGREKVSRLISEKSGAPEARAGYAPTAEKPVWVWLFIGFLLGTGGTLLASSFWLPESGHRHVVASETGDGPAPETDGAVSVTEPSMPERMPVERDDEATSVAALDVESAATSSPDEGASPSFDEANEPPLERRQVAEATADEAASEALLPNAVPNGSDAVAQREIDGDRSTTRSEPEETLSTPAPAPVPETVRTETVGFTPPARPDDRSPGVGAGRGDRVEPAPPAPEGPTSVVRRENLPVAGQSDDEQVEGVPSETSTVKVKTAETAASDDSDDLPPRIRQALSAARVKSQSTTGAAAEGGRLYRVQLGAVHNLSAARIFWQEVNQQLPGVFTDVEPIFNERHVDERLFFRIWVGAFDNRSDAESYCNWLKLKDQNCFVTRVDNL